MNSYSVNRNAQSNGDHEVHKSTCPYFPSNPIHLGNHSNCESAVEAARKHFSQVDGCATCSPRCHKS